MVLVEVLKAPQDNSYTCTRDEVHLLWSSIIMLFWILLLCILLPSLYWLFQTKTSINWNCNSKVIAKLEKKTITHLVYLSFYDNFRWKKFKKYVKLNLTQTKMEQTPECTHHSFYLRGFEAFQCRIFLSILFFTFKTSSNQFHQQSSPDIQK